MRKVTIIAVLSLIAFSSQALDNNEFLKVERVDSWIGGDVYVWLDQASDHQCTEEKNWPNRYMIRMDSIVSEEDKPATLAKNTIEFNQKYSMILAAKTSGQLVKFKYDCDGINAPRITAIRFQ